MTLQTVTSKVSGRGRSRQGTVLFVVVVVVVGRRDGGKNAVGVSFLLRLGRQGPWSSRVNHNSYQLSVKC